MSRMVSRGRIAQVAAVLLGLVVLGMLALTVVLDSLTHYPGTGGPLVDSLAVACGGIPAVSVATLLAARRPGNPIGWLLFGILFAGSSPSNEYDILAYRMHHGTLPLGWVSVVFEELWPLFLVFVAILLWVFPDGKLPGGRWRRPSVILLVVGLLLGVAASSSGIVAVARGHVRITATGDLANPPGGWFVILDIAVIALSLAAWLAWIVIQIPTYRKADGERRQQLKWLYSGAAVTLVAFVFGVFVVPLATGHAPGYPNNPVISALVILAFGAMPASLGVAVLKYRLYELDRIISRVVSYTLITALLVGVYTGLVLLATHGLPFKSAVSVAACTLITAALFNPLRKRVQRVVDRRFNRSRYNAEAVVAAFTARMRQTVEFDAVRDDLVGVVHEAFQPTQVSMWLVEAGSGRPAGLFAEPPGGKQGCHGDRRAAPGAGCLDDGGYLGGSGVWERLERREIRRRRIRRPDVGGRPRPDLPEGTDLLPEIRHIVVLMMENHSYDNYLGMLAGRGEGLPVGPDGTPDVVNRTPNGRGYHAHHMTSTTQVKNDPSQNWRASHIQYADGRNDGFAAAVAEALPGADPAVPMGYWTEEDLPFYYGLARTFPLADRWFSSCLGPTFPNRRFLISGTAHGLMDDLPWDIIDYPEAGTIFDVLTGHDIGWVNYHNVRHYSVLLRLVFGGRGLTAVRRLAQTGRWLPGVADRAVGNKSFTADLYPLGLAACVRHLRRTEQFFADADAGRLPAVSIVDPDFETYSEENPQDIRRGESFAAEVINRVMGGPAWPHTLLIWFYDEHGGYYDHVPPPEAVPPDDVPAHNYVLDLPRWLRTLLSPVFGGGFARLKAIDDGPRDYARYGFRVPAVVVSPYARPDYVCGTTLDHTSVLKLIEEKWNLPPLTRRDAAASSPLDMVDLEAEPAFAEPPKLPEPALRWGSWGRRPRRRRARDLKWKSVRLAQRRATQRRTARS